MTTHDIPLDKAELLSVILEGLFYGFSLLMFGGTMWALLSQRSTEHVNCKMVILACLLLLFSTAHFVIDIIRAMQGFVVFRDTFPGGPVRYFSNMKHWTFVSKNYLYAIQTLIGDGVVLHRCHAAWQSKLVMIPPVLLWFSVGVTGIACASAELITPQRVIFIGSVSQWIICYWASSLLTNLLTTFLLAYRIWYVDHKTAKLRGNRPSQLRPLLHVVIDAGLIYFVTLFVALICFVNGSNAQYVILDTIPSIISITFYMVIIRVGLAHRESQTINRHSAGLTSIVSLERRTRAHVHILATQVIDNEPRSPMNPILPVEGDTNRRSKVTFEHVEEFV